jgi:hypothetical protein
VRPLDDNSLPMPNIGTSSFDNSRRIRDCFFFFEALTFRLVLCPLNNVCILVANLFFLRLLFSDSGDALNVGSLDKDGGDGIYNIVKYYIFLYYSFIYFMLNLNFKKY